MPETDIETTSTDLPIPAPKINFPNRQFYAGLVFAVLGMIALVFGGLLLASKSQTPQQATKHGDMAVYSITESYNTPAKWYMIDSNNSYKPEQIVFKNLATNIYVTQIVDTTHLLLQSCLTANPYTECNIYSYNLTDGSATILNPENMGNASDAHMLANGNVVMTVGDTSGNFKVIMVHNAVVTVLQSLYLKGGRDGGFGDAIGITLSPDNTHFLYANTYSWLIDGLSHVFTVYDQSGSVVGQFCPVATDNSYCTSPWVTNNTLYYEYVVNQVKQFLAVPFASQTTTATPLTWNYDPHLDPSQMQLVSWNYDYQQTPGVSYQIMDLATETPSTKTQPYSNPSWLNTNNLIAVSNKSVQQSKFNFIYSGLAVIDKSGNIVQTLEDGKAFTAGDVQTYQY